ncbi:MAG: NUDIX hydrolase [Microthrixaceae bacterium]
MSDAPVVRAAGCVVWRHAPDGSVEVVVVHRPPPHGDWSLPKGKLDPGESHRDAAVREVHEETALRGTLGPKLAEMRYTTPRGEDKRVRWWAMELVADDGFTPNDEIDQRRWVPLAEARHVVSWDTDRVVLDAFVGSGAVHLHDTSEPPEAR